MTFSIWALIAAPLWLAATALGAIGVGGVLFFWKDDEPVKVFWGAIISLVGSAVLAYWAAVIHGVA